MKCFIFSTPATHYWNSHSIFYLCRIYAENDNSIKIQDTVNSGFCTILTMAYITLPPFQLGQIMKLITFNIAIPSSLLPPDWFKKLIYHHLFACISVGNKWKMKLCSFPRKNWKEYLSKPLLKFHLISGANLDWFNTTFVPCLISRWVPNFHSVAWNVCFQLCYMARSHAYPIFTAAEIFIVSFATSRIDYSNTFLLVFSFPYP